MKDRVSANPGRYRVSFENESLGITHATLELADNPTEMGTPLNAATLCSGEVLIRLGLSDTATPTDAFNAILDKISDTGWRSLWPNDDPTTDTSITAKAYGGNSNNAPIYRKAGNIVYVMGAVSAKETVSAGGDASITVGTLPKGFRPSRNVYTTIHGSYGYTAVLNILSTGTISISRHSNGTAYQDITTSSWLRFNASFII